MTAARVSLREELIFLLNQAAELEHSLCCAYLFTGLSLKSRPEDGLPAEQLEATTRWKRVFNRIAVEEMTHLAMVNNLLMAIGAAPNLDRPNFPHGCSYYMPDVHIQLRPFSEETVQYFVMVERPSDGSLPLAAAPGATGGVEGDLDNEIGPDPYLLASQGDVYDLVRDGLEDMVTRLGEQNVFVGPPTTGAMRTFLESMGWEPIEDLASARAALARIVEQGEGGTGDSPDSHYNRFLQVLHEYQAMKQQDPAFEPAFPVLANPFARTPPEESGPVNLIDDELAIQISDLFNEVYTAMLQLIARFFVATEETDEEAATLARASIDAMSGAMIPLGEGLVRLPAGAGQPGMTAGPSFVIRTLHPLPFKAAAWHILAERFEELRDYAGRLAGQGSFGGPLTAAAAGLSRVVVSLKAVAEPQEIRMARGVERVYQTEEIAVSWEPSLCIHSANCIRSLPDVFNPRARPWVSIDNATADELAAAVMTCPSGALTFRRLDGKAAEPAAAVSPGAIRVADVPPGTIRALQVGGNSIAVANVGGALHAFENVCPHIGCALADGPLAGNVVTCPCHGSQFDVTTGAVLQGPALDGILTYRVEVEGDQAQIVT